MSCFTDFFRSEREVCGNDPTFGMSIAFSFRVIFANVQDLDGVTGELSAGFFNPIRAPAVTIKAF
jgi:hypothetical protein